jgi:hypothetical protein
MPTSALMTTLMALVENYIKDIVSAQVIEIMTNHQAMRVIDDGFESKMRDIAVDVVEDAISVHNDSEYHISESDIDDTVSTAINDFDFDDKVNEAVNDAINDFDFTDVITASIKDNITFSVSVD